MLRNRIRYAAALALCAAIALFTAVASAETWYCPRCGRQNNDNFCPRDGVARPVLEEADAYEPVLGLTTMKIATRSGPSTGYTEQGTYQAQNQYLPIYSIAYDNGGVAWVQCEVTYGGALRRVYTGLKRFDTSTFDLSAIPEELENYGVGRVGTGGKLKYGPGDNYATMDHSVSAGMIVTIVQEEDNWYQIEFTPDKLTVRGWVPAENVFYPW